jgi:hypothetical protein
MANSIDFLLARAQNGVARPNFPWLFLLATVSRSETVELKLQRTSAHQPNAFQAE